MSQKQDIHCTDCFGVLADKTRLRIVQGLQQKTANVAAITEEIGLTQPTVSHHLKLLDDYGIVVKEKRGRETYYTFNPNYPCKGCGVFSSRIKL